MMETMDATAPFWVAPGDGEAIWFQPDRMTVKASAETTGGAFGLLESTLPGGASPPLHVHHREDESFWVIEGQVRFRCGDLEVVAGPGSFVFLPRDIPHTFRVDSEDGARLLTLLTPGGGEGFFLDGGREPEGPGLPPPGPPAVPTLKQVAPLYGAEIVGPPLAPATPRDS
jgi:mannose-6-phosphate isomerase-like protein (cupin superfamily)